MKNQLMLVTNLRKEFSKIYEHDDANLKLHITFAYLFKELPFKNGTREDKKALKTELLKLVEMLNTLKLCTLTNHNIYLYNSMTNYFPIDFFFSSSFSSSFQ